MKTVRRKAMKLAFEPIEQACSSFVVSAGQQKLGHVSYVEQDGHILIFEISIEPYLQGLSIETQIFDAILSLDRAKTISVVSSLSYAGFLEDAGFECDRRQILLTKKKDEL